MLCLFIRKSDADLERIRTAPTEALRREAAHALLGSARAIGADEVARLAVAVENGAGDPASDVDALEVALAAAQRYIRETIGQ